MRNIYDYLLTQYGNSSEQLNLHQMIEALKAQLESLESRMDAIMNDLETLKEENVETTNVLYELQNSIEAVDRRIDILAEDSLKVTENEDRSFDVHWEPNDPKYTFLNSLTKEQQQELFIQAITESLKENGN